MYRPFRIEDPAGDVLTPDQIMSEHVQITEPEERALASVYLDAAVSRLDGYTGLLGRCLLRQRWALPLGYGSSAIVLPFPDCRDLVVARKQDTEWIAEEGTSVERTNSIDVVQLLGLPSDTEGLALLVTAGWESASEVPEGIKQCIRIMVAEWFHLRRDTTISGNVQTVPHGAHALISQFKHIAR